MGLLDWLTDSLGSIGDGNPSAMSSAGTPPMPSDLGAPGSGATPPLAASPVPSPGAGGFDPGTDANPAAGAGGAIPPPGAGPSNIPLPQPRPAAANAPQNIAPPLPPSPPPSAAPGGGSYGPLNAPQMPGTDAIPPPPQMGQATSEPAAHGIIGRALGLNPNTEASLRRSVGAGLTAAGNSAGKSPAQAFATGAGAGTTAAANANDKTVDQQNKALANVISANNSQSQTALRSAQTQQALADAKYKMTGGKDSVMNSDQQLYLRAMGVVNNDPEVKLARSAYDAAVKADGDPDSPRAKAAYKTVQDLIASKTKSHLQTLGVDPSIADKVGKQPGMSQDNPMDTKGMKQQQLDALPPGSYIRTPDGKVLIKKAPAGANPPGAPQSPPQGAAPQAAAPQSSNPSLPPLPPQQPQKVAASDSDNDEED